MGLWGVKFPDKKCSVILEWPLMFPLVTIALLYLLCRVSPIMFATLSLPNYFSQFCLPCCVCHCFCHIMFDMRHLPHCICIFLFAPLCLFYPVCPIVFALSCLPHCVCLVFAPFCLPCCVCHYFCPIMFALPHLPQCICPILFAPLCLPCVYLIVFALLCTGLQKSMRKLELLPHMTWWSEVSFWVRSLFLCLSPLVTKCGAIETNASARTNVTGMSSNTYVFSSGKALISINMKTNIHLELYNTEGCLTIF